MILKNIRNIKDIWVIILAAGLSSRMGRFKALLPLGANEHSAVSYLINSYNKAGIENIIVVGGHNFNALEQELKKVKVQALFNKNYHTGMWSSVLCGLKALPLNCCASFVHPVDIPLVDSSSIKQITDYFIAQSHINLLIPTYNQEEGHPPVISKDNFNEIIQWSGAGGLRGALASLHKDFLELQDQAILLDMDTNDDYKKLHTLSLLS